MRIKIIVSLSFMVLLISGMASTATAQDDLSGLSLQFSNLLEVGDVFEWETVSEGIFFEDTFSDGSTVTLAVDREPNTAFGLDDINGYLADHFSLTSTGEVPDDEGIELLFVVPITASFDNGTTLNVFEDLWEALVSDFFDFNINGTLDIQFSDNLVEFTGNIELGISQEVFFTAGVFLSTGIMRNIVTTVSTGGQEVSRLSFSTISEDKADVLPFNFIWAAIAIPILAIRRKKNKFS